MRLDQLTWNIFVTNKCNSTLSKKSVDLKLSSLLDNIKYANMW